MAVEQITSGVWRPGTRYVNWYIVDAGGDGLTLIDAGLPGYSRRMHAALASSVEPSSMSDMWCSPTATSTTWA